MRAKSAPTILRLLLDAIGCRSKRQRLHFWVGVSALALFVFMSTRRSLKKHCEIVWRDNAPTHHISRETFNKAIASGWIVQTGERIATIAHGVKAQLHNGVLWLEDAAAKATIWIYTSWISINRISPVIEGDYYKRELLSQYGNVKSHRPEPDGTWIERCDWKESLGTT